MLGTLILGVKRERSRGLFQHPARASRFLLSHTECQNAPEEPDAHALFQLCRVKPYTRRGR